ncbi:helix-turn-helix domain-containing protein [Magnetospirillum sp. SS-4]|uniref:helix-turn-helix domain-containing protein n=1 Tax=Magnetospirillum sp. SS-4 TaxID=2681465 RepID=UPI0013806B87|nr:helix-turn-helix transcriptional regulator [Magnetospirillum sp. SS-4]CAA7624946.1 Uncharacterized HTH-type transcriptional regulator Smed_0045 [Magnetospirillum sp. SS-4]
MTPEQTINVECAKPRVMWAAPSPTDQYVGDRLRHRRQQLGMTQTELGRAIGLTLQQVQKYERGVNRVSCSRLFDLSKALHVSVSYFFDGLPDAVVDDGAAAESANSREAREFIQAYYGISDPNLRSQVWELAKALAPSV